MKLRNKKTGEVVVEVNKIGLVWNRFGMPADIGQYDSLAELNEEWEDYKPKEPKLEGEVREIVRHWANLHGYDWLRVGFTERASQRIFWVESPDTRKHIDFLGAYVADDFEAGDYSIYELCGEEEPPEPVEPTFVDLDERVKEKEEE